MPWQQISPQYVRQDHPGLRAAWYRDTAPRGGGELMVWVDPRDRIVAFQLSHEPWPQLRQYVAEWRSGSALRIGQVDEGEGAYGGRVKPAPLMRFDLDADPLVAGQLLRYFQSNATPLRPEHRRLIASVLSEGTDA